MESLKSLDMNLTDVTDVLVPVYSVLALLFIIAYRMSPETKVEDRYFLKKAVKSTVKKDWREVITGFYHQSDSDGFDDWLKFLDRPFAIRMIAPKMFHKIHIDLTVTDTHVSVERYWSSEKTKGDGEIKMQLGTSRDDAPVVKYVSEKKEDCGEWRGWVPEGEEKVYCDFVPDDPNAHPAITLCRESIDEDTVHVTWNGRLKGKTCSMTSTYRRV
jgi:hypothetical protein